MVLLTEPRYKFVQEYLNLLDMVEEGIELVDLSYQERNFGSGDKLLKDLINAFGPFSSSNQTMKTIFSPDKQLFEQLCNFQKILEQVSHLETIFHDEVAKSQFTQQFFNPSYKQWKKQVYKHLQGYMAN